jgi:hypothetical protein
VQSSPAKPHLELRSLLPVQSCCETLFVQVIEDLHRSTQLNIEAAEQWSSNNGLFHRRAGRESDFERCFFSPDPHNHPPSRQAVSHHHPCVPIPDGKSWKHSRRPRKPAKPVPSTQSSNDRHTANPRQHTYTSATYPHQSLTPFLSAPSSVFRSGNGMRGSQKEKNSLHRCIPPQELVIRERKSRPTGLPASGTPTDGSRRTARPTATPHSGSRVRVGSCSYKQRMIIPQKKIQNKNKKVFIKGFSPSPARLLFSCVKNEWPLGSQSGNLEYLGPDDSNKQGLSCLGCPNPVFRESNWPLTMNNNIPPRSKVPASQSKMCCFAGGHPLDPPNPRFRVQVVSVDDAEKPMIPKQTYGGQTISNTPPNTSKNCRYINHPQTPCYGR